MRIFITLLILANVLFLGVSLYIVEPEKGVAIYTEERKKDTQSLVLLAELDRDELIADLIVKETQVGNKDEKQLIKCLKIVGDWDQAGLLSVKDKIDSLDKYVVSEGKERRKKVNYWVVIPPFSSRVDAVSARRALQRVKVVDTFIIQSGSRANALSMGLYSKEESAKRRVNYINAKKLAIAKASIETLTLYVDQKWIKIAPVGEDLEVIKATIGEGIIDTEIIQCEIDT
ncbi:MAG: hypothetical protein GQ470_07155 [Gammaproteobacteria bacterium]|nr:hypothetical protein [Gammaproteobacteria bacterium]